jgi:glycosyltransferase involved in cell wall biosynthesis
VDPTDTTIATSTGQNRITERRKRQRSVLVLNQFAPPRSAAGGTRHVELFERLRDWDPLILAGRRSHLEQSLVRDEGALRTVPVTRYSGNGSSRVVNWASYTAMALLRGLFHRRWDLVYGSSPHMGAALAGWLIATAHRAPFVLEVRDLWPQILVDSGMMTERSPVFRTLKSLERFLYRRADAIVVLAKGSVDAILDEGISGDKLHFIPNGADPEDFEVSQDRAVLRERFGFDGTVVVYAGAHGPANGLDLVLDAAERLTGSDITFVLVGDGVMKQELQDEAKRRGITNVDFRSPIPKAEIPQLFAAADIGLHCLADIPLFNHGVSPNKLYDYMAAGLPVITNTPGEVAAMVKEAGAGETVDPDDIASGVRTIQALTAEERAALGCNGRQWMTENRSRRALARKLNSLLSWLS